MNTGRTVIAAAVIVGHLLVLYGVVALAAVGRQRATDSASEPIIVTMIAARGPAPPAARPTPEPAAPQAKPSPPPTSRTEPQMQPQRPVRSTARSEPPRVRRVPAATSGRTSPPAREEPPLAMRDPQTPAARSVPPIAAQEPAQPVAPAAAADPPPAPSTPSATPAAAPTASAAPATSIAATTASDAPSASAAAALSQAVRTDQGPGSRGMPISEGIEYLREPQPWYPPLARQRGEQGRVVVLVWIDARGVPGKLAVHASSGSPRLDRAALDAAAEALFKPFVEHGQPVPRWALVPIAFRLD